MYLFDVHCVSHEPEIASLTIHNFMYSNILVTFSLVNVYVPNMVIVFLFIIFIYFVTLTHWDFFKSPCTKQ